MVCRKNHSFTVRDTTGHCPVCVKAYRSTDRYKVMNRIRIKRYESTHKNQGKNRHLLRKFNITLDQYNVLFEKQNGLCLGCYQHQSNFKYALVVDHCHKTGKIRGLLCNRCNSGMGLLRDNPEILTRLSEYLQKHAQSN